MIEETDADRRRDRGRLFGALLASVLLHVFTWSAVTWSAHLPLLRNVQPERETVTVAASSIRLERRTVRPVQHRPAIARVSQPKPQPPKPRRKPRRTAATEPQSVSLLMPANWKKQDYGNIAATDVPVWLDWSKQTSNFVPRVMLWQMQADQPYMSRPSLENSVQGVVASLRAESATVSTSKAARVCNGRRSGWYLSYVKPGGDPPVRVEETLFAVGQTIYGAIYVRPANQREDAKAREALNTLCQR